MGAKSKLKLIQTPSPVQLGIFCVTGTIHQLFRISYLISLSPRHQLFNIFFKKEFELQQPSVIILLVIESLQNILKKEKFINFSLKLRIFHLII